MCNFSELQQCFVGNHFDLVATSIDQLKLSLDKPWYYEWPTFAGIFLAALFAYTFAILQDWQRESKEKKNQKNLQAGDINAALIALDQDFIQIISFKKQHIVPYIEDKKQMLPLLELEEEDFNKVIEIYSKSESYFKSFPSRTFFASVALDKLIFFAHYRPVYLATFYQVKSNLTFIEYAIHERNKFIDKHMDRSTYGEGLSIEAIRASIRMLSSYCDALEFYINSALSDITLSLEHIKNYSDACLPEYNFLSVQELNPDYKKYMPSEDSISDYRRYIEKLENKMSEKK